MNIHYLKLAQVTLNDITSEMHTKMHYTGMCPQGGPTGIERAQQAIDYTI